MVFFFSGTGNSQWVAEQLAILTKDAPVNIASLMAGGNCGGITPDGRTDCMGLVFPIYAWGAPGIVAEFLDAWEQNNDAYRYGVCTCGDDAGYGMEKLRKRFPWNAAWSVAMPNNYIPMYDVDSPGVVLEKIAAARDRLPKIAEMINARATATDIHRGPHAGLKTYLVNPLFKRLATSTRPFMADDTCTGCGLCAGNCPCGAIQMAEGKPVWIKKRCLQCMACIHHCPAAAIQYGKATRGRGRYTFQAR